MKRIAISIAALYMLLLSCSKTTPVETGTTPMENGWEQICEYGAHDTERIFQGLLHKDGELLQFFDKGMVNILDAKTMEFKRSFQLPYHGHYSTVEWLDDNRFASTDGNCNLYVTDLSDMTCDTIHLAALNPEYHTAMACLAYDRDCKTLYVSGYGPSQTFRRDVVTAELDMSGYMDGSSREIPLITTWSVPSYHIQDGCFYKGLIYHLVDKTIGQASKPYDCLSVYVLDPKTKSLKTKLEVPLTSFTEAQGLAVYDDHIIVSDLITRTLCRYYRINLKYTDGHYDESYQLSPRNRERNALCAGYALYNFEAERVDKPAPEGYEPFYMVHYGRHGARYLGSDAEYDLIHNVFASVPDEGFTPLGRAISGRYESVYPELTGRGGDLSDIGKRQLSLLGKRYIESYPQIFCKGAKVLTECSKVQRCIISAAYFCDELDDAGCKVDLNINSALAEGKIRRRWYPEERNAYTDSLLRERVDVEGICQRLFKDGSKAVKGDAAKFVSKFWSMACNMQLTHRPDVSFTTAFSYEDLVALKSVEDDMYRFGRTEDNPVINEYTRVLLDHLFAVAAEDIKAWNDTDAENNVSARLFFGHDTVLMSLMCLLSPEGWPADWSTSDIPVAANLRIVFYRNASNDILCKIQFNESDVRNYGPPVFAQK